MEKMRPEVEKLAWAMVEVRITQEQLSRSG